MNELICAPMNFLIMPLIKCQANAYYTEHIAKEILEKILFIFQMINILVLTSVTFIKIQCCTCKFSTKQTHVGTLARCYKCRVLYA